MVILIFPVFLSTFDDGFSKPLKLKEHNQEGRTFFANLARSWWYDNTTTWELRNEDSFTAAAAAAAVKACAFPLGSLVEYWIFIGLSGGKTH